MRHLRWSSRIGCWRRRPRPSTETICRYWDSRAASPLLDRMLYADQKTYLAELLMKQDQMSMSCSIESRVPFLDHTFVEFSTRVPDSLKMRGSEQKYILKKAVEDILPHRHYLSQEDGFPHAAQDWLRDRPAGAAVQRYSGPRRICGWVSGSQGSGGAGEPSPVGYGRRHGSYCGDCSICNCGVTFSLPGSGIAGRMVLCPVKRRAPPYEVALGKDRFPPSDHSRRPDPDAGNRQAAASAQRSSLRGVSTIRPSRKGWSAPGSIDASLSDRA